MLGSALLTLRTITQFPNLRVEPVVDYIEDAVVSIHLLIFVTQFIESEIDIGVLISLARWVIPQVTDFLLVLASGTPRLPPVPSGPLWVVPVLPLPVSLLPVVVQEATPLTGVGAARIRLSVPVGDHAAND